MAGEGRNGLTACDGWMDGWMVKWFDLTNSLEILQVVFLLADRLEVQPVSMPKL